MSGKPNDFKLGLFILCGLAILLAGLFVFGASKIFEGKTVEETYVKDGVEGLKPGAQVLLRGVPVGQVTRINFSWNVYHVAEPRYVVVEFEVGNQVALVPPGPGYEQRVRDEVDKGLRARIKSEGLAGATVLSLEYVPDPKENPALKVPWTPRHVYIPSAPGQLSQIVASMDRISENLKQVDFQKIGAQVERDLVAAEVLLRHVDHANIAGLSTNLNGLVTDLRTVSTRLEEFVGPNNVASNATLPRITTDADRLLAELRGTTHRLDHALAGLDESALNEALENVRRATQELEAVVHQFKQYPSGVLFGERPLPARSVERPKR